MTSLILVSPVFAAFVAAYKKRHVRRPMAALQSTIFGLFLLLAHFVTDVIIVVLRIPRVQQQLERGEIEDDGCSIVVSCGSTHTSTSSNSLALVPYSNNNTQLNHLQTLCQQALTMYFSDLIVPASVTDILFEHVLRANMGSESQSPKELAREVRLRMVFDGHDSSVDSARRKQSSAQWMRPFLSHLFALVTTTTAQQLTQQATQQQQQQAADAAVDSTTLLFASLHLISLCISLGHVDLALSFLTSELFARARLQHAGSVVATTRAWIQEAQLLNCHTTSICECLARCLLERSHVAAQETMDSLELAQALLQVGQQLLRDNPRDHYASWMNTTTTTTAENTSYNNTNCPSISLQCLVKSQQILAQLAETAYLETSASVRRLATVSDACHLACTKFDTHFTPWSLVEVLRVLPPLSASQCDMLDQIAFLGQLCHLLADILQTIQTGAQQEVMLRDALVRAGSACREFCGEEEIMFD
jgi:hypothetical protein